ncbi:hypothetical protein [Microbacterium karelineae]|uniref:hypothetical protein n=1 Tax=Microbacterium karelineae TaxID=2654283 RepID=UPI0012EA9D7A|nr:hypothetical protein [Microbacterium karelineae]
MPPLPLPLRIIVTWSALFPLVVVVQFALSFIAHDWPTPVVTALTLAIVVPIAVAWVVPFASRLAARLLARRRRPAP